MAWEVRFYVIDSWIVSSERHASNHLDVNLRTCTTCMHACTVHIEGRVPLDFLDLSLSLILVLPVTRYRVALVHARECV